MSIKTALFQGLTGRAGTPGAGTVRDMLTAAFGTTSRGRLDTRSAAEGMGVSQRTIQRWVADESRKERSKPRPSHLSALKVRARQAASTKKGRRQASSETRQRFAQRKNVKLSIAGNQGPAVGGKDYSRKRTTTLDISDQDVQSLLDAYEQGGDKAAQSYIENLYGDRYVEGWSFNDMDQVSLH